MEIESEKNEETTPYLPSVVQRETIIDPIDPIAPFDVPRDIAVGHKRPSLDRKTLQEVEGHLSPCDVFEEDE
jgi:hypothetical protein